MLDNLLTDPWGGDQLYTGVPPGYLIKNNPYCPLLHTRSKLTTKSRLYEILRKHLGIRSCFFALGILWFEISQVYTSKTRLEGESRQL